MKGLSKLQLQKALGKLLIKRSEVEDATQINVYIEQLEKKLKNM